MEGSERAMAGRVDDGLGKRAPPAPFPCALATEKTLEDADDALSFIALLPRG